MVLVNYKPTFYTPHLKSQMPVAVRRLFLMIFLVLTTINEEVGWLIWHSTQFSIWKALNLFYFDYENHSRIDTWNQPALSNEDND